MSLPDFAAFRTAVDNISPLEGQLAIKCIYEVAGRVGEICNKKYDSDRTANPLGSKLSVFRGIYTPDLTDPDERDVWTFKMMMEGRQVNYAEISKIVEPVCIFRVATEKRGGFTREIGLPLDPKYDPWVEQVYNYLSNKKTKGFDFYRQELWVLGKKAFADLHYTIHPYKRGEKIAGEYQHDEKNKLIKFNVDEHTKPFTIHGIRHLKNLENRRRGLTGEERSGYGGWTLATTMGTSAAQDRYEEHPWRIYFPKLLKRAIGLPAFEAKEAKQQ